MRRRSSAETHLKPSDMEDLHQQRKRSASVTEGTVIVTVDEKEGVEAGEGEDSAEEEVAAVAKEEEGVEAGAAKEEEEPDGGGEEDLCI